jgi:predicted nucleic acid-binding protein
LAPGLALAEITNALLQNVASRALSPYDANAALRELPRFLMFSEITTGLCRRALALALSVRSRAIYDFYFVALAEELGCELWTADERSWRTVRLAYPRARLLGVDAV